MVGSGNFSGSSWLVTITKKKNFFRIPFSRGRKKKKSCLETGTQFSQIKNTSSSPSSSFSSFSSSCDYSVVVVLTNSSLSQQGVGGTEWRFFGWGREGVTFDKEESRGHIALTALSHIITQGRKKIWPSRTEQRLAGSKILSLSSFFPFWSGSGYASLSSPLPIPAPKEKKHNTHTSWEKEGNSGSVFWGGEGEAFVGSHSRIFFLAEFFPIACLLLYWSVPILLTENVI